MSKKKSFFERLTGSISFAENEGLEEPNEPEVITETSVKPSDHWLKEDAEEGELAVDVYQTPTEIIVKTMVAGVRPEDLNITITREMVTIKGKREEVSEIRTEDYFQRELYWGAFAKTILLPAEVEAEEAEATERHGLITLRLPKIDKARTQKLKIKSV